MKKKENSAFSRRRLVLFCSALLFFVTPVFSLPTPDFQLSQQLEHGFRQALATPEGFKATEVFRILGYLEPEIALIGKITPHPQDLRVEWQGPDQTGCFSFIKVTCSQVSYYNLTIATATFEFPNCRLDHDSLQKNQIRFLQTDEIKLKTEVSEADILKVFDLYAKAKSLRDLSLNLSREKANLGGWFRKGILTIKFDVRGSVELVNPKVVNFSCERLALNRIALPRNTARSMLANINPVFDSRKTWLNLNIDSINILDGFVETNARINRREG